ncbi:cyclic lactone autoinducer peptide [Paenibacillus sinopodophylli]|nr:cyclic lactone autoinducer peptide [Paenibacillus sinopodophylli]
MFKRATYGFASALSLFAVAVVSTASFLFIYQDETPAELLKSAE